MAVAHPYPDGRRRGPVALLAATLCLLLSAVAGTANQVASGRIEVVYETADIDFNAGTQSITKLTLTQGDGTLVRASVADVSGFRNNYDNSTWKLSGAVHVEHQGAVLDAEAATIVFAGGRLQSVQVEGNNGPSRFSYQASTGGQRYDGSAPTIHFDAMSGGVRFFPPAQFSTEGFEGVSDRPLHFNTRTEKLVTLDSSDENAVARIRFTEEERRRVPPPRQPERNQAQ
jgi:hypothetical protein